MKSQTILRLSLGTLVIFAMTILSISFVRGQEPPAGFSSVAWSNDGTTIAIAGGRGVLLYPSDLSSHRYLTEKSASDIDWHPDSRHLAVVHRGNRLAIWDTRQNTRIFVDAPHGDSVQSASWNPDGSRLASVGTDKVLRIWDANLNPLQAWPMSIGENYPQTVRWSPDGLKIAVSVDDIDGLQIYTFNASNGVFLARSLMRSIMFEDWALDSQYLVGAHESVVHYLTGQEVGYISCATIGLYNPTVMSPNGKYLAGGGDAACLILLGEGYKEQGRKPVTPSRFVAYIDVAWSPDSSRYVMLGDSGWLDMIDGTTGKTLFTGAAYWAKYGSLSIKGCTVEDAVRDAADILKEPNGLATYIPFVEAVNTNGFMEPGCIEDIRLRYQYFLTHPTPTPDQRPKLPLTIEAVCSPDPSQYRVFRVRNPNWFDTSLSAFWIVAQKGTSEIIPGVEDGQLGEILFRINIAVGDDVSAAEFSSWDFKVVVPSSNAICPTPTVIATYMPSATPTPTPTHTPAPVSLRLQYYPDPDARGNLVESVEPDVTHPPSPIGSGGGV